MRETFRAWWTLMAIAFRAAPWHAGAQLILGMVFASGGPVMAWGAKLITDAVVEGDMRRGLIAAGVIAVAGGMILIAVFYYVDCVFSVFERTGSLASRRLMRLSGGTAGIAHHERPEYLDQMLRIREEGDRLSSMVNAMAGVLRVAATLSVTVILLAGLHPLLLLLPAVGAVSFWLGRRGQQMEVAAQEATSEPERLRRHLFELGTSADTGKELRVFGAAKALRDRHHAVSEDVIGVRDRATWRNAGLRGLDGLVSAAAYAGAITLVLWLAVSGRATAGDVVMVVGLTATTSNMVGTAVAYGTQFMHALRVARRLIWLEDYAAAERAVPGEPAAVPEVLREGIVLQDVSFGYPADGDDDTGRRVLEGLSITLPAGSVVALVGENGAGKTTLVKLLTGFYQPTAGRIEVDGVDLQRIPAEHWRTRVGAAFQDFVDFEFLAGETVGVGDLPRIDDDSAIRHALTRAGAGEVVDGLPSGTRTRLGSAWPGGVDLSGGQWQRLALARGLMRNDPLLVVFDEPTAALDPQTEHALFERFADAGRGGARAGTVTLLVSHRFSTVRMADLIIVLDGGLIAEYGSHAELMSFGGLYAELYELQSRAYR